MVIMSYVVHSSMRALALGILTLSAGIIYVIAPHVLSEEVTPEKPLVVAANQVTSGKRVIVNLTTMKLELKNGTSTPEIVPIVSKGKPGSYYETPGGRYTSDYKEKLHFSSIGHVYMPLSVHVFGNFFIHGIPYYPDGTRVAGIYSGGCIRLSDEDAQKVYDFVEKGTPVIITQEEAGTFMEETSNGIATEDMDMTRSMVATISLEFLTQDNDIEFRGATTTRRELLRDLLIEKDDTVSDLFASHLGKGAFIHAMNTKARALNLSHTVFTDLDEPAQTTDYDAARFKDYISTYKSYVLNPK